MDKNRVIEMLMKAGYKVVDEKPYKGPAGYRLKIKQGSAVFCMNNGKIFAIGKLKGSLTKLIDDNRMMLSDNDAVFVAFGHDRAAKEELLQLLQDHHLTPIIIDKLPTDGRTIVEQLEHYIPKAYYGIVLATPDDIGFEKNHPEHPKYRARQNVVLELGMLLSKLGRKKVMLLTKTTKDYEFECPSDIDGVLYKEYKEHISEVEIKIIRELQSAGYKL